VPKTIAIELDVGGIVSRYNGKVEPRVEGNLIGQGPRVEGNLIGQGDICISSAGRSGAQ